MDWDSIRRNWKTMKRKAQEKWSELSEEDLDFISGQRDKLEGKIQERYGFASDSHRSLPIDPRPASSSTKKLGCKRTLLSSPASSTPVTQAGER